MRKINIIPLLGVALLFAACNLGPPRQMLSQDMVPVIEATEPGDGIETTDSEPTLAAIPVEPVATTPAIPDVWQRIRQGLQLERHLSQKSVKSRLRWYKRNQDYIDRTVIRATPYLHYIVEELERRDMPLDLALLPIVESAYYPFAYSRSHAAGIWQFIPSTGRLYGLQQNHWYDGRRDIVAATDAALRYLDRLQKRFNGDWLHALAAYNSGERKVERAIRRSKAARKDTDFFSLRLPRETRGYVPSLLAVAELLAHSEQHGINWNPVENTPYFAEIKLKGQIDLAIAARLAELDMDEFYTLNPGYNSWATAPDGLHRILVPVAHKDHFMTAVSALPKRDRLSWHPHTVKRGETLGEIASRYRTSVTDLRDTNNINGSVIQVGSSLLVPVASEDSQHYTLSRDNRRFSGLKRTGDGKRYIYTVKWGDSLWEIGKDYGFSIKQLAYWNGIRINGLLRPGQKLTLWLDGEGTPQQVASVKTKAGHDASTHSHTVRKGDTLWDIGRHYGVSVAQLRQWNNLSHRSTRRLMPGQKLIIRPVTGDNKET
ncbi:MAG: LysM peptidoglycan-binding domain-containing protein [Gammaproteobacteria bacterium]